MRSPLALVLMSQALAAEASAVTRAAVRMSAARAKPGSTPVPEFDFEQAAAVRPIPTPSVLTATVHADVLWHSKQLWDKIGAQADALATGSTVLGRYLNTYILGRADFPTALAMLLAEKLHGHGVDRSEIGPLLVELCHADEMHRASLADMVQVTNVDPAGPDLLTVLHHFKGFHALQVHRAAHQLWMRGDEHSKHIALMMQGRCAAAFSLDIHPAARIGAGVFLDHGTGIVIGETAAIGEECYLLHGVTLGSTGKLDAKGRRHPQVGSRVKIGASAAILGPVRVADDVVIGAKAIVTKEVSAGQTVVGTNRVLERSAGDASDDFEWMYDI